MADWTNLSYAVTDVEGNGQQPPDLVEVAVLPIEDGSIGDPVSWLVRPPRPITRYATRIHGITGADVAGAPPFGEIRHEVHAALVGRAIVAHNAHVDIAVLGRELGDWDAPEVFDTLKLARRLLPSQPSYKLGALVKALGLDHEIPPGMVPHRGAYDVLVTARLFTRLASGHDIMPVTLEELRGSAPNRNPGDSHETATLF